MSMSYEGLAERVKLRLNAIPEKDAQGSEQRFAWQLGTFVAGCILQPSSDLRYASLGQALCNAAATSFGELLGTKIRRWVQEA